MVIGQSNRNTTVKGRVYMANTVSGKKENAIVVFKQTQENADHGVADNI